MIPLALSIAILDEPTRLTCLETDYTSLLAAALGAAACCHNYCDSKSTRRPAKSLRSPQLGSFLHLEFLHLEFVTCHEVVRVAIVSQTMVHPSAMTIPTTLVGQQRVAVVIIDI